MTSGSFDPSPSSPSAIPGGSKSAAGSLETLARRKQRRRQNLRVVGLRPAVASREDQPRPIDDRERGTADVVRLHPRDHRVVDRGDRGTFPGGGRTMRATGVSLRWRPRRTAGRRRCRGLGGDRPEPRQLAVPRVPCRSPRRSSPGAARTRCRSGRSGYREKIASCSPVVMIRSQHWATQTLCCCWKCSSNCAWSRPANAALADAGRVQLPDHRRPPRLARRVVDGPEARNQTGSSLSSIAPGKEALVQVHLEEGLLFSGRSSKIAEKPGLGAAAGRGHEDRVEPPPCAWPRRRRGTRARRAEQQTSRGPGDRPAALRAARPLPRLTGRATRHAGPARSARPRGQRGARNAESYTVLHPASLPGPPHVSAKEVGVIYATQGRAALGGDHEREVGVG